MDLLEGCMDLSEYRRRVLAGEGHDIGHDGRVYLACRNCGERITLYRFFGLFTGTTCRVDDPGGQAALAEFLVKHASCWIGESAGEYPAGSDVPDLALMVY